MSEKHVIHHKGDPRPDPASAGDGVAGIFIFAFLWKALTAIGVVLAAINTVFLGLMGILPILLAAGVISYTTYALIKTRTAQLKINQSNLQRLEEKLRKLKIKEEALEKRVEGLPEKDRLAALEPLMDQRNLLIKEWHSLRSRILDILKANLADLKNSRNEVLVTAHDSSSSPEKFTAGLHKLDETISELNAAIRKLEIDNDIEFEKPRAEPIYRKSKVISEIRP